MRASRTITAAMILILMLSACDFFMGEVNGGTQHSEDTAAYLGAGWNLGNTLDAYLDDGKVNKGLATETCWGMPETTRAMIRAVKARGFKTIRIPVSWHNHITDTGLTIDRAWLNRVRDIADWALDDGMYVIINIHHDNLTSAEANNVWGFTVNENQDEQAASIKYISSVWSQVAGYFKDYGESLIFEVLNEPRNRDAQNDGFTAPGNLWVLNKVISLYNQAALDAIRSAGGKNKSRYVMVPMYAASPYDMDGWTLPKDSAEGRILISAHAYTPYEFCMSDTSDTTFETYDEGAAIDYLFSMIRDKWTGRGYGVVIGEMSATDKNNTAERLRWFSYYCRKAKDAGVSVILWDNMTVSKESGGNGDIQGGECHGYLDRENLAWFFPTLVERITSILNE